MNILITGASGFIGCALLAKLQDSGHSLICQSRSPAAPYPKIDSVRWIQHDLICDSWEDQCLPNIDVVYHLSGQTSISTAKQDPSGDLAANVTGILRLLVHLGRQSFKPFLVFAGTVTQAGLVDHMPINEAIPDRPISFYDISKLTAELYLMQFVKEGWIRGCSLRLSNVYGGSLHGQQQDRGVIDKILRKALSGEDLTIYGEGNYFRDYVFIEDVVSAFIHAAENQDLTNGKTFCIGTGEGVTLNEAFHKAIKAASLATGKLVDCKRVPPPSGSSPIEFRNAVIDSSAFNQATGWSPSYNLDSGLKASIQNILTSKFNTN
jgi:nucleoside-diphosphate-sugar epimerase